MSKTVDQNFIALQSPTSPLGYYQSLAALVVPGLLCCALRGNSSLAVESRVDLDCPGAAPLVMGGVLAGMTFWLARQEFRNSLRR